MDNTLNKENFEDDEILGSYFSNLSDSNKILYLKRIINDEIINKENTGKKVRVSVYGKKYTVPKKYKNKFINYMRKINLIEDSIKEKKENDSNFSEIINLINVKKVKANNTISKGADVMNLFSDNLRKEKNNDVVFNNKQIFLSKIQYEDLSKYKNLITFKDYNAVNRSEDNNEKVFFNNKKISEHHHTNIKLGFNDNIFKFFKNKINIIKNKKFVNLGLNNNLSLILKKNKDENNNSKNLGLKNIIKRIGNTDVKSFNIVKVRKPENKLSLKKKVIVFSLALAIPLTGLCTFISSHINNNGNKVSSNTGSTYITQEDSLPDTSVTINNDLYNLMKQRLEESKNNKDFVSKGEKSKMNKELNIVKEKSNYSIGDNVKCNASYIYNNVYDAMDQVNGDTPYFGSDKEREVKGLFVELGNEYVYYENQKDIDDVISKGGIVKSIVVGDENGYEGAYNVKDVKVLSKVGSRL